MANCRAVVAGSYHAAVFSLALGIPAVCLTRSAYYDAKFSGLVSLFPGACQMIGLGGPGWAAGLREAIGRAWRLPPADRGAARAVAARLQGAGRDAYARLGEAFGAPVAAGQHRGPGW